MFKQLHGIADIIDSMTAYKPQGIESDAAGT